ncbi:MAG: helix-turn-helix transcriptional regulator [Promethearchaeota archaeon]
MSKRAIGRELDRYEIDRRIVETIALKPQVTIEGIAQETGLSYTAVKNSLHRLRDLGVVIESTKVESPARRGRPAFHFQIDQGLTLFIPPRQFQHLALTLVSQLAQEEGQEYVAGILERAAKSQVQRVASQWEKEKSIPRTLEEMVRFICAYINEQGCYARHRPSERGFYILVNNCVYNGIAGTFPGTICRFHESLIFNLIHQYDKSLLVEHEQAMAEGAHNCRYAISRP